MITIDLVRVRLIQQLQKDLRKKALSLSVDTIELVLDAYDKRVTKEVTKVKGKYNPYDTSFVSNLNKGL